MPKSTTLGFIGLGSMGSAMSARLLQAGHDVIAFDVARSCIEAFEAKGGRAASSLAHLAREAEIVFASLPSPQIVAAVLGDEALTRASVRIVVDLSTTGPAVCAQVAAQLRQSGIEFADSPVSGGRAGALKGTLSLMVACPPEVWQSVEDLLKVLGKPFYVGGAAGQAQTMKLINNLLSVVALAATCEGMTLGVKAGLDPQLMLDVFNASSARNSATTDKFPRAVLPRSFDFGFTTELSNKDLRLCLEEADALGVPMLVGSAARTLMSITQASFGAHADFTSMVRVVEQWAGVEVRGTRPQVPPREPPASRSTRSTPG